MIIKISEITPGKIARNCDHTYLDRPEAFRGKAANPVRAWEEAFANFLQEAINLELVPYSFCVRPETVDHTRIFLENNESDIKIDAVAGFPHWIYDIETKIEEAVNAVERGADEIDFVLNYKALQERDLDYVREEMRQVSIFGRGGTLTKLILETSELDFDQITLASRLAEEYDGIHFIKTSTGFSSKEPVEHKVGALRIMRANFSRGIKVSEGVNKDNVLTYLEAISGRTDGYIDTAYLNPLMTRFGESSYLKKDMGPQTSENY